MQRFPETDAVGPGDPRYRRLAARGYNKRYAARPEVIHLARSAEQVEQVVGATVAAGKRLAVRSGGHCEEPFVDDHDVRVLIDLRPMRSISYDPGMRAFLVEPGATLGEVFAALHEGWGVTIPAGSCPSVGVGGHIPGGAYGPLSREHGMVVDHLYAVEVVVVGRDGRARRVVATREHDDPNHDLWWGHTGAGGGNFGVVTRYWLRSAGVDCDDPGTLLPRPPSTLLTSSLGWLWKDLDEPSFTRLVRNHCQWYERNSADGSPYAALDTGFTLNHRAPDAKIMLELQISGDVPGAAGLVESYVADVVDGVDVPYTMDSDTGPWLDLTLSYDDSTGGYPIRFKSKGSYLRKCWSEGQLATLYRHLTDDAEDADAGIYLHGFGGRVNAAGPAATANPHRDSILVAYYNVDWLGAKYDERWMSWMRAFYRDMHADTGGVPVPGPITDGSYINYPDVDLADPAWNTSGVPWHTLYFKDNYPRLQEIKARWDPLDVFRHTLSVRLPGE
jgi:aclacinomycin oxidase